jgi:hypothetical protein
MGWRAIRPGSPGNRCGGGADPSSGTEGDSWAESRTSDCNSPPKFRITSKGWIETTRAPPGTTDPVVKTRSGAPCSCPSAMIAQELSGCGLIATPKSARARWVGLIWDGDRPASGWPNRGSALASRIRTERGGCGGVVWNASGVRSGEVLRAPTTIHVSCALSQARPHTSSNIMIPGVLISIRGAHDRSGARRTRTEWTTFETIFMKSQYPAARLTEPRLIVSRSWPNHKLPSNLLHLRMGAEIPVAGPAGNCSEAQMCAREFRLVGAHGNPFGLMTSMAVFGGCKRTGNGSLGTRARCRVDTIIWLHGPA